MNPASLHHFHFNIITHDTGLEGPDIIIRQFTNGLSIADIKFRAVRGTADVKIPDLPVVERRTGMGALVPESVKLTVEKKKRDDLVPGFDLQARAFFKSVDLGNFVPHECVG